MDWGPVQSVPHLSPNVTWDRFPPHLILEKADTLSEKPEKKDVIKGILYDLSQFLWCEHEKEMGIPSIVIRTKKMKAPSMLRYNSFKRSIKLNAKKEKTQEMTSSNSLYFLILAQKMIGSMIRKCSSLTNDKHDYTIFSG